MLLSSTKPLIGATALAVAVGFGLACAPSPRSVRCTSNHVCRERDPDAPYCVESHCVECVSRVSCEEGVCDGGRCVASYR